MTTRPNRLRAIQVATFIAYVNLGTMALLLAAGVGGASAFWLPGGLALGVLVRFDRLAWPAIPLAAFAAYFVATGDWPLAIALAVGNTLEAILGAALVDRVAGGAAVFRSARTVFRFVAIALVIAAITATLAHGRRHVHRVRLDRLWVGLDDVVARQRGRPRRGHPARAHRVGRADLDADVARRPAHPRRHRPLRRPHRGGHDRLRRRVAVEPADVPAGRARDSGAALGRVPLQYAGGGVRRRRARGHRGVGHAAGIRSLLASGPHRVDRSCWRRLSP